MGWVSYKDTRILGELRTHKFVGGLPVQLFKALTPIIGL